MGTEANGSCNDREGRLPLPIWFFVGVILLVYGLLVIVGQAFDKGTHAAQIGQPGYWWGAILVAAGVVFTALGLVVHRKQRC